jgi:hypothetical protein
MPYDLATAVGTSQGGTKASRVRYNLLVRAHMHIGTSFDDNRFRDILGHLPTRTSSLSAEHLLRQTSSRRNRRTSAASSR